jgi:hypothetical protein
MNHSYTEAEDLLGLEFDDGADFGELVAEVFGVCNGGWEFAGCEKCKIAVLTTNRRRGWTNHWKDQVQGDEGFA